ncbi:divergent PAP2 family protein [Candidatus Omnitrophota bacterium]
MSNQILSNTILWATLTSWFIAQMIKIVLNTVKYRKFYFSWILTTGGMPSAHAASVTTLATAIGLKEGFSTPMFALSAIVALIAMFDAHTWRRSIGTQARILNTIMDDVYAGRKVAEEKLRELIGHTPVEVFVGGLLGILVAFVFYQ